MVRQATVCQATVEQATVVQAAVKASREPVAARAASSALVALGEWPGEVLHTDLAFRMPTDEHPDSTAAVHSPVAREGRLIILIELLC